MPVTARTGTGFTDATGGGENIAERRSAGCLRLPGMIVLTAFIRRDSVRNAVAARTGGMRASSWKCLSTRRSMFASPRVPRAL